MRPDHIVVTYGNLTVKVPRLIFVGPDCVVDDELSAPFRNMMRSRYPWLSENSVNVLLDKARKEMIRVRDAETSGKSYASTLEREGRIEESIAHVRRHIEAEPDNGNLWYLLGELLCKSGDAEAGYAAINRGRSLKTNR